MRFEGAGVVGAGEQDFVYRVIEESVLFYLFCQRGKVRLLTGGIVAKVRNVVAKNRCSREKFIFTPKNHTREEISV